MLEDDQPRMPALEIDRLEDLQVVSLGVDQQAVDPVEAVAIAERLEAQALDLGRAHPPLGVGEPAVADDRLAGERGDQVVGPEQLGVGRTPRAARSRRAACCRPLSATARFASRIRSPAPNRCLEARERLRMRLDEQPRPSAGRVEDPELLVLLSVVGADDDEDAVRRHPDEAAQEPLARKAPRAEAAERDAEAKPACARRSRRRRVGAMVGRTPRGARLSPSAAVQRRTTSANRPSAEPRTTRAPARSAARRSSCPPTPG